jgi:hypothetical protein
VPEPTPHRDDDAVIAIARYRAALDRANRQLGGTEKCIAELSARYANYAANDGPIVRVAP